MLRQVGLVDPIQQATDQSEHPVVRQPATLDQLTHQISQLDVVNGNGLGRQQCQDGIGVSACGCDSWTELAKIVALAEENLRLAEDTLSAIRIERWSEVEGHYETMRKAVDEGQHIGAVTDGIWQNVQAHESTLASQRKEFHSKVADHVSGLNSKKGHKERREFLEHHGHAIVQDAQALMMAQAAWFMYQAVRAGHLHLKAEIDATSAKLLERVVAGAREERKRDVESAASLLRALNRELSLMAELPGRRSIPFTQGRKASVDVRHVSRIMLQQLASLDSADHVDPVVPEARLAAFKTAVPEILPRILRWHLDPGEELLALVEGDPSSIVGAATGSGTYLAVTGERILVADKRKFGETGELTHDLKIGELRYVRFVPPSKDGKRSADGSLDIITTGADVRVVFDDWAADGDAGEELSRIVQLLRSRMHLPADEIPGSPLDDRSALGAARHVELTT